MILNKHDYIEYLEKDRISNSKVKKSPTYLNFLGFGETIWVFLILLRKLEYIKNCKTGILWKIYFKLLYYYFSKHSMKLGFSIPLSTLGKGISLPHRGAIVIYSKAKIGNF